MDTERALARLRDADHPAADQLAGLVAEWMADRPASDVIDPASVARHLAEGLRRIGADPAARDRLVARLDAERARWSDERRPLRSWVLPEAHETARALLSQPWVPSEQLVLRLINHDAVRKLLAEVLHAALSRFAQRVRTLDQGLLGGIGGRVARGGRGLLGVARELGAAADGLVGGLRDEVEQALERRVKDHLGGATDDAVRGIAAWIAAPEHAEALAGLRVSILDEVLALSLGELLGEIDEVPTAALVDAVLHGVREASARSDLTDEVAARIAEALDRHGGGTLGGWLDDAGLRDAWRDAVVDVAGPQVRALAATEGFEAWWSALFR